MQFGLSDETVTRLIKVFAAYPDISEVIVYGSRAKGSYNEGSDIDLCLKGTHLDATILQQVSNDIDDLLLPYIVDISIYSAIKNKELHEHIQRVGKTLYRREL